MLCARGLKNDHVISVEMRMFEKFYNLDTLMFSFFQKIHLEDYMLFAHGPDLCEELTMKHAMANCFEALMGNLFF